MVADPGEETGKALEQLKDGKAPGTCGVYAEMLKVGGESALKGLHRLICSVWNSAVIPSEWKRVIVVLI